MIENLAIGLLAIMVCLVIQCLFVTAAGNVLLLLDRRGFFRASFGYGTLILILTMMFLLFGNIAQMSLWALLFTWLGEFSEYETAFYHSVVNFTTVGYGDVIMSDSHRLLGALEGANGVLMFGLTTSVTFIVMNRLLTSAWHKRRSSGVTQDRSKPS